MTKQGPDISISTQEIVLFTIVHKKRGSTVVAQLLTYAYRSLNAKNQYQQIAPQVVLLSKCGPTRLCV